MAKLIEMAPVTHPDQKFNAVHLSRMEASDLIHRLVEQLAGLSTIAANIAMVKEGEPAKRYALFIEGVGE